MPDYTDLIERYIDAWNETDEGRRRTLVAQVWTDDASYRDPLMKSDGHAGIEAMIAGVQTRFPEFRFSRGGQADGYDDQVRFTWRLGPAGGEAVVEGTDFATLAPDGRLSSVTGFIDRMPTQAP